MLHQRMPFELKLDIRNKAKGAWDSWCVCVCVYIYIVVKFLRIISKEKATLGKN